MYKRLMNLFMKKHGDNDPWVQRMKELNPIDPNQGYPIIITAGNKGEIQTGVGGNIVIVSQEEFDN